MEGEPSAALYKEDQKVDFIKNFWYNIYVKLIKTAKLQNCKFLDILNKNNFN